MGTFTSIITNDNFGIGGQTRTASKVSASHILNGTASGFLKI